MDFVDKPLQVLLQPLLAKVEERTVRIFNVKEDMKDIAEIIKIIDIYLDEAESRALYDREGAISIWVRTLRNLMYDMEDVVTDYEYEKSRIADALFYEKFLSKLLSPIPNRIKKVQEDLLKGLKRKELLYTNFVKDDIQQRGNRHSQPIVSVIGDKFKKNVELIMNHIMESRKSGNYLSIIALTGMGGVGKTTLAQNIYSQLKALPTVFDVMCWVPVTESSDDEIVFKAIMEGIRFASPCVEIHELCENWADALMCGKFSKTFFVVLDDIWDRHIFDKLIGPLLLEPTVSTMLAGSTILVTTRDDTVAKHIRADRTFPVEVLPEDDALSLLYQSVFSYKLDEEEEEKKKLLRDIGLKIVKRCGFLPLAIKAIGGVLRTTERLESEWKKILDSDLWSLDHFNETVMRSLYVSYRYMKPACKKCFLHLSLFPRKYKLDKSEVVNIWVAEGLAEKHDAEDYYKMLEQSNLLQQHPESSDEHVMHDIVHSFIRGLTNREHAFDEKDRIEASNIRRYSISNAKDNAILRRDMLTKSLRSLMFFNCPKVTKLPRKKVLGKMRHLRVLNLKGTGIKVVPSYINKLVQLRLLDVSETPIKMLPKTTGDLVYLQVLGLSGCPCLNALPESLTNLKDLRILDTGSTHIDFVPKGLGKLTKLESLAIYAEIKELGSLNNLRELHLHGVEGIEPEDAEKAKLEEKKQLRYFCVFFADATIAQNLEDVKKQEKTLEALRPPACIQHIKITNLIGRTLPNWLSRLQSLQALTLGELRHVKQLGVLPKSLTKLSINDAFLEVIPELPAIKDLRVTNCLLIKRAGPFRSLEMVHWDGSSEMTWFLPEWLGRLHSGDAPTAPSLQHLCMNVKNPRLIRRVSPVDDGSDWPLIRNIPDVHVTVVEGGSESGQFFRYEKEPFSMHVHLSGMMCYTRSTPVEFHPWSHMDFSINSGASALPRQITPATRLFLERVESNVIEMQMDKIQPHSFSYFELPFNFHNHLKVTMTDGTTQVLCIDQQFSTKTGFVAIDCDHIHLPFITGRNGESNVACFSERLASSIGQRSPDFYRSPSDATRRRVS